MSKQPIITSTLEEWIKFGKSIKYGDECHVFCDDLSGEVIEWASEEDTVIDQTLGGFLHPVHTFRYLGLGSGLTAEANPKGTCWHHLDEYRDRVMDGSTRIIVTRHKDLTIHQFEKIKAEVERQIGKVYGWGALLGFGLYKLVWNTPIGKMWRDHKWNIPWCSKDSPVCSQGVCLQEYTELEWYNFLKTQSTWEENTPMIRLRDTLHITEIVYDTFKK